jgi:hypothetical protein
MIHSALAPLVLALAPMLADRPDVVLAQLTVRERIVVRVRRMPAAPVPRKPVAWKERKGPRCISPGDLAGVLITKPGAVDMVMYGGKWLRAKLDGECRSLDFYSGIYLKPGTDGQVCADRDVIRARSGANCGIATFKLLQPRR